MWLLLPLFFFLNHSSASTTTTNANKSDKEGGKVVFEAWDGGNDYVPLTLVGK